MNRCIGCGDELKKDDHEICSRCFRLKNYGEYEKVDKDNKEFLTILNDIKDDDLVLYVTSLFNLNIDYIDKFKNVILVLTKKDILPKSIKDIKLIDYIKNKNINILDIEVISSIKNYNLDSLMNKIKKYKTTNNVYVVGNTNSGKSTLVNKIIKNYYNGSNIDITTSLYPSTTLDKIEIKLSDDLNIIDTPGLVDYHSFIHNIELKLLKKITPKKEIKPRVYQINNSGSILIEDMVRIEYETKQNSMVIYIANNINILIAGKNNNKLKELNYQELSLDKNMDIVIPDLCFIKFTNEINLKVYIKDNVVIEKRANLI